MKPAATARNLSHTLYGCYAWVALLGCVLTVVALLAVTPDVRRRRGIARRGAQLFLLLIGSRVRVEGSPPANGRMCIVVANHASYLDGIILTAVLPAQFTFLIKHDMARFPIAGFILRRLGSEFVNRSDSSHRNRIARRLVHAARNGDSLALFPEGTFAAAPGLRRFHAGAFGAAWRAGVPVIPVVIDGSRAKLPAGRLLAAPGPITVRICAPLHPDAHPCARTLTRASRQAILVHLDEPDLDAVDTGEPAAADSIANGAVDHMPT